MRRWIGMDGGPLSPAERRGVTINDRALLIYTSGTTGLPKAASISHRRILNWGGWFAGLTGASTEDRLYDCLPLSSQRRRHRRALQHADARAARWCWPRNFPPSSFWHDIVRWDCTLFQYIGELCRYLLKAPPSEFETRHRLRLACGNGLRGDIWEAFQARFAIPQILEFYAATEGNFSLYNVEGKPGAIGRIPPLLAHRFPAAIVRVDMRYRHARCAATTASASPARAARPARPSGGSAPPTRAAAASRAIPTPARPKRRSCATCSPGATPGFAPAT